MAEAGNVEQQEEGELRRGEPFLRMALAVGDTACLFAWLGALVCGNASHVEGFVVVVSSRAVTTRTAAPGLARARSTITVLEPIPHSIAAWLAEAVSRLLELQ